MAEADSSGLTKNNVLVAVLILKDTLHLGQKAENKYTLFPHKINTLQVLQPIAGKTLEWVLSAIIVSGDAA